MGDVILDVGALVAGVVIIVWGAETFAEHLAAAAARLGVTSFALAPYPVGRPASTAWPRTGQVESNGGGCNPLAPFGGYKQSGHGRELGRHGLEEFLTMKSLQR